MSQTSKSIKQLEPNEQISILPNSLIDYLAKVPGAEIDKSGRVLNTGQARDTDYIPKVKNAGKVVSDKNGRQYQVMHNGIKVAVDGYYGDWVTESIRDLRGHHEPQEEKVFYEVAKRFSPDTWMIELGAYWSYYSLWFHKVVPNAHNICCEPDPGNKKIGQQNMKLNGFNDMRFIGAAAGKDDGRLISFYAEHAEDSLQQVPIRSVDSLVREYNIDKLEVLHIDVQGVELDALKGAEQTIKEGKLRFVFVSTHHYLISRYPNIHQDCLDFLNALGGHIIAEHDIHESYSGDGLIVASFDVADADFTVEVSRHRMVDNQFRSYAKDLDLSFQAYEHILNRLVSQNIKLDKLDNIFREQEDQLIHYKKEIEHLNNLHIPSAFRELIKSIRRSLKSRIIKLVWGENNIYQPSDRLRTLAYQQVYDKKSTDMALVVISEDDSINLARLIEEPSRGRVIAYEVLRRISHIPNQIRRRLRGGRN